MYMMITVVQRKGKNKYLLRTYYILGLMLTALQILSQLILSTTLGGRCYYYHFTIEKLRQTAVRWLGQGHTAKSLQLDLNSDFLDSRPSTLSILPSSYRKKKITIKDFLTWIHASDQYDFRALVAKYWHSVPASWQRDARLLGEE